METIKEPLQEVEHRAVEIYCPNCHDYRELYMEPLKVTGGWPVKKDENGLYPDFTDVRELSFKPSYVCQACGHIFPFDMQYIGKLLKDEET